VDWLEVYLIGRFSAAYLGDESGSMQSSMKIRTILVIVFPVVSPCGDAKAHVSGLGSEKVLSVTTGALRNLHGLDGDRFPRGEIGRRPYSKKFSHTPQF
jgi:hypothetical protein